jgi:hypothetical protein
MTSEKMFKEFVARLASDATAIYFQSRKELQEERQHAFEVHDSLRAELEVLEDNLAKLMEARLYEGGEHD